MVSGNMSPSAASLRRFIDRLVWRRVENWTSSDDPNQGRPEVVDIAKANIVTSNFTVGPGHALLLDLDHPAWLVKSSTEGHHHLYVDVPGGIPYEKYMRLLDALADCGVIEAGYASASKARGYTSVFLPWKRKGQD